MANDVKKVGEIPGRARTAMDNGLLKKELPWKVKSGLKYERFSAMKKNLINIYDFRVLFAVLFRFWLLWLYVDADLLLISSIVTGFIMLLNQIYLDLLVWLIMQDAMTCV